MRSGLRQVVWGSLLGAGLWLAAGAAAAAEGIAVIVSAAQAPPHLDTAMLRDIYLKKIFLDETGRKFIPVNLAADHPLRQAVSAALFPLTGAELQDYWNQRYFHGVTPPYVLGSQDAIVRFVANTPGAIGYVAPCYLDARVQPVLMLPVDAATAADLERRCPAGAADGQDRR